MSTLLQRVLLPRSGDPMSVRALYMDERTGLALATVPAVPGAIVHNPVHLAKSLSTLDQLTSQELQIARLLAEGRTTREAAAAAFLSPKTIEYHLRNVYRKLDVRSRAELSESMARLN